MNPVTQPPGPYSGRSTLSFVIRVSVFTAGVVYGNMKLKYYRAKVRKYQKRLEAEAKAAAKAEAKAHH